MNGQTKKEIRQWVVSKWTSSFVYKAIDKRVSKFFQRRLKNDEFSILCSNCIGGIIYHRLGKRFLSPTINMYIKQPDFVSFCIFLDYYLEKELVFIENDNGCPTANLEGNGAEIPTITILFIHEKDEAIAKENWEKRKKRIRYDNLFIMMYKIDGVTIDQLRKLEQIPCRNKIVLTAQPLPEISWSYCIKPNMRHQYPYNYLQKNLFGVRYFERAFDFVSFLNGTAEKSEPASH